MNIENMLNQLKNILPAENFKVQPAAAFEELLELEKEYNINTSTFIASNDLASTLPEEVCERWINTLDTFINFNGSMDNLNHLSSYKKDLGNKPFVNDLMEEDYTKEYANKQSKESNWLPCLFLYLQNFINFHTFFWMEQKPCICAEYINS